jgi:hypothetical protein
MVVGGLYFLGLTGIMVEGSGGCIVDLSEVFCLILFNVSLMPEHFELS